MPRIKINLKKNEVKQLEKIIKKGNENTRVITRARTLLLLNNGMKNIDISSSLMISPGSVVNIKKYYVNAGLEGAIFDSPRSGAPCKFTTKDEAKVQALACTEAPEGYSQWSLSLLAEKAVEIEGIDSISKAQVGRILKKIL